MMNIRLNLQFAGYQIIKKYDFFCNKIWGTGIY